MLRSCTPVHLSFSGQERCVFTDVRVEGKALRSLWLPADLLPDGEHVHLHAPGQHVPPLTAALTGKTIRLELQLIKSALKMSAGKREMSCTCFSSWVFIPPPITTTSLFLITSSTDTRGAPLSTRCTTLSAESFVFTSSCCGK